jgi:hypothetical protein
MLLACAAAGMLIADWTQRPEACWPLATAGVAGAAAAGGPVPAVSPPHSAGASMGGADTSGSGIGQRAAVLSEPEVSRASKRARSASDTTMPGGDNLAGRRKH